MLTRLVVGAATGTSPSATAISIAASASQNSLAPIPSNFSGALSLEGGINRLGVFFVILSTTFLVVYH
jgi:hypothetical protein